VSPLPQGVPPTTLVQKKRCYYHRGWDEQSLDYVVTALASAGRAALSWIVSIKDGEPKLLPAGMALRLTKQIIVKASTRSLGQVARMKSFVAGGSQGLLSWGRVCSVPLGHRPRPDGE